MPSQSNNYESKYSEYSEYNKNSSVYFDESKPINWRKYLFLFISHWYWFLITLGIALGIAFFKIRYTIPNYEAKATIIIEEDENSQDILGEFRMLRYWRRQVDMANEIAKLKSFSLTNRAIYNLDQDVFWTAYGRIRVRPLYYNPRFEVEILSDSGEWYKNKEWYIS